MSAITLAVSFETITCSVAGCGVTFALSRAFVEARQHDHVTWYCPHGHPRYYPAESDVERLGHKLAQEQHRCEQKGARVRDLEAQMEAKERSLRATRANVARWRGK